MDIHRLLLYIIFGCAATFSQVAPVGQKPECHALPKGTVRMTTESDICEATSKVLGHFADAVTLNFSQAEKKAFDLLTKGFNTISAAFVMDGNEHVETVNFASIIAFDGSKLGKGSPLFIIFLTVQFRFPVYQYSEQSQLGKVDMGQECKRAANSR